MGCGDSEGQNLESFAVTGLFQNFDDKKEEPVEEVEEGPPTMEITEDDFNQKMSDSFNAGLKDGKELAERGLINVFRALRASSETVHNMRDKIFRESEDELINLIMLVARKVISHEISQNRSILAKVVQSALAGLSAREEITVRINPDDYQLVTSGRDDLLRTELLNERLLLKPDPSVEVGFCLVDTDMGTIDASLEGQLDQIYRSFLEQRTAAVIEEP
jgi:flagellar assembly protein FliH